MNNNNEGRMSFLDHLDELRTRIIRSLISVFIGFIISFSFVKPLVNLLEKPAKNVQFLQLSPGEFLFSSVKVAGYSGLFLALPYIIFEIYQFILPGLSKEEKSLIGPTVAGSAVLFFLGLTFSYFVLTPAALKFLVSFGADVVDPIWSIERYLDFIFLLMLSTGLAFQLPIIQFIFGTLGLINSKKMLSGWRWVIIISAISSAVITPSTDPITMSLLTIAITFLFLIGVLAVSISENFKSYIPLNSRQSSTVE
tara:strand:- start:75 stop:833 length:759 start_codon:yes stop_codon:yes gene_type:complete